MHRGVRHSRGVTLLEIVVVFGLIAIVAVISVAIGLPWLARESLRSAVHDVQSTLQVNRLEAVKRNRPCRLVVDTTMRALEVWDGMGTASVGDDVLLHRAQLPSRVDFADPEGGMPVTFSELGGSTYEVIFNSDGTVGSGNGDVFLSGGGIYRRLTLQVAGGVRVTRWNGSAWEY
jgi:Tfp pilus assembly protein FimT